MDTLYIFIEINGEQKFVGTIHKTDTSDGIFCYSPEYLADASAAAISCRLPLREEPFDEIQTRRFFDGLLPEGFTRRTVAGYIHADPVDYLSILENLGKECLGAIKIVKDKAEISCGSYEALNDSQVLELAREGSSKSVELVIKSHLSLTGASGKAGLYYEPGSKCFYLPVGDAPSTHIVKQSHIRFEQIVVNEQLALQTASLCGLPVPVSFVLKPQSTEAEDVLFATQRYDRTFEGAENCFGDLKVPLRLHQEDFAQALGIPSSGKYEKQGERFLGQCFDLLRKTSSDPIEDQMRLWDILVFDFLIGNTDNHIKNISLLYGKNLKSIRLAPAYDILSTTIYEASTRDMSIYIGDECSIDRIGRESFAQAASEAGLGTRIAERRLDEMADKFEKSLSEASRLLTQEGFQQADSIKEKILSSSGYRVLK